MNIKKVGKEINKYYHEHNQTLIVDCFELIEGNEEDCCFDLYLKDSDIALFTIQNYNGLRDLRVRGKTYFKHPRCKIIRTWDGVLASYLPLYYEDTITLKTFKAITREDIVNAVDYYVHEILGLMLFNIKFAETDGIND
jgi:hypothetical protein